MAIRIRKLTKRQAQFCQISLNVARSGATWAEVDSMEDLKNLIDEVYGYGHDAEHDGVWSSDITTMAREEFAMRAVRRFVDSLSGKLYSVKADQEGR